MIAQTRTVLADFRTLAANPGQFLAEEESRLQQLDQEVDLLRALPDTDDTWQQLAAAYIRVAQLEHRVMLRNPLLNFDRLLLVKRRSGSHRTRLCG